MSQGPHVTPEVKALIAKIHVEHTDWGATKIRKELLHKLKERGLHKTFGPEWPGVGAVRTKLQRIIGEEKAAGVGGDPEDRPWSVTALADYDIPPEALPVVMNAWAKALVDDAPLTIRQVKWIARLYCIMGTVDGLIVGALEYASQEKAIKLTGAYPDKPQNMRWLWFGDTFLYWYMEDSDKDLVKRLLAMYNIEFEIEKGATQ